MSKPLMAVSVTLIFVLPIAAHAAPINITINNYTASTLTMTDFGPVAPGYVGIGFGGGGSPGAPAVTTFTVDDGDQFSIDPFHIFNRYGHTFHVSGGALVADNYLGYTPLNGLTNQYFDVSGTTVSISGARFNIKLLSQPGGPGIQYIDAASGYDFFGTATLGGPDYTTDLVPDDGMFSGLYPGVRFGVPNDNSVLVTMTTGPLGGIASIAGPGATYTPISAYSGIVTLTGGAYPGEQLLFYLAPEPTSAVLLAIGGVAIVRRRGAKA